TTGTGGTTLTASTSASAGTGGMSPDAGGGGGMDGGSSSSHAATSSSSGTGGSVGGPGEGLANTDLSQDGYLSYMSGDAASMGLMNGQYCFVASAGNGFSFVFGYPDPNSSAQNFSLDSAASYTLSYQLSGSGVAMGPDLCSGGMLFEAKI